MRIILKPLIFFLSLCILAQTQDQADDVAPYPPDVVLVNTLPETIGYSVNYYTLIPMREGPTELTIQNLAQYSNAVLVVGVDGYGNQEELTLQIAEGETGILPEASLAHFELLYVISLQPFHVQSEKPLSVMGIQTRHFSTIAPTRHLEMVPMKDDNGRARMVGVTPDGIAYFPVFGYKIGRYDREAKTLFSEDGRVLEIRK